MQKETKYLLSGWEPIEPTLQCSDTARHYFTNREFKTRREVIAFKKEWRKKKPAIEFSLIEKTTKVWYD